MDHPATYAAPAVAAAAGITLARLKNLLKAGLPVLDDNNAITWDRVQFTALDALAVAVAARIMVTGMSARFAASVVAEQIDAIRSSAPPERFEVTMSRHGNVNLAMIRSVVFRRLEEASAPLMARPSAAIGSKEAGKPAFSMSTIIGLNLRDDICDLIRAEETELGLELSLPIFFPNGEAVTVIVTRDGGEYLLHDAGFGVIYLDTQGMKVDAAARSRIVELVARYGCQFVGNRVMRRCSAAHLATAAVTVANASRTVGDQALEISRSHDTDFREAVIDGLRMIGGGRLRENQAVKGKSGRTYRVPAIILDRHASKPVAFVSAISTRASIPTHLMELFDLKGAYDDVLREAVYDESGDLRKEDRRLISQVSDMVPFTQAKHRFLSMLAP